MQRLNHELRCRGRDERQRSRSWRERRDTKGCRERRDTKGSYLLTFIELTNLPVHYEMVVSYEKFPNCAYIRELA